jgi:ABC-2 type transport system ATP-binding protein
VREYLDFVAEIKGVAPRERKQRVDDGHGAHARRRHGRPHCGKLSKGYRQRVGLAQALIHNPKC